MAYASISVEGGIFPSDLLDRIATGDAEGQRDGDFQSGSARLSDATQSAFSDMRAYWAAFQRRLGHSGNRTTVTRETWMVPLLETLGYKDHGNTLSLWRPAPQIDGVTYAISHRAGQAPDSTPVHIVSIEQSLDRRAEGSRRSAHATVQEFLNRAPALWGIATNGAVLRLLRDTQISSRPTYVEFDLRAMVEDNLYSEFVLLYRLLQRTRLPKGGDDPNDCLLESYYQLGIDEGGRVREHLREGVEVALEGLGNALLAHPESGALREALRDRSLDQQTYYRQLLRLIYRLLFLMVAEERKLLLAPDSPHASRQQVYQQYYGIARLRDRAERRFAEDRYIDLWEGLLQTFLVFREEDLAGPLGLSALNGELFGAFACGNLEVAGCENRHLLRAIYHLSTFKDGDTRRRVNYAGLDVEELGSVYESLLDLQPRIELDPPRFTLIGGNERKATGSYYTPPQLVRELVESALVPVMEDRLRRAGTRDEQEQALLDLRICDPACGSGHFLLAAARRVAGELARVRSGGDEPAPEAYRAALRETIRSCIYAVDRNPLAVDLCKVALWIEGFNAGLPLSFLDNHIKWGDSLVGVFDLEVLEQGIPDGAYTPVTGDDKASAGGWKKLNGQERGGQRGLLGSLPAPTADVAAEYRRLGLQEERTPYEVHAKERDYQRIRGPETDWWRDKTACDLWTAAFFLPIRTGEEMPTSGAIRDVLQHQGSHPQLVGRAVDISQKHPFFHWPLEFPDVFDRGGFDVVLGNPPWERIKLQEQEFFAQRDPEIAGAPNKAERERLIKSLPERRPVLAAEFEAAKHTAEAASKFVRLSARFPLCGRGDVNTYSIFAELNRTLVGPGGRAGCITPSGIATDDTTKLFFADLMKRRSLASLYDFENGKIFPEVDSRYRFCLLTMTAEAGVRGSAEFAFFLHDAAELGDAGRRLALSTEDLALLNPNTLTCPIFRTQRDAEITKAIYRRVPVLIRQGPDEENPWGISFLRMLDMSNDSGLFHTRAQLESGGWRLESNIFRREDERYLPLYEAKMLHQFDHRWATYDGDAVRDMTPAEKQDPGKEAMPRYWVPEGEVQARLDGGWDRGWLLGWRDTTNCTNERTVIAGVLPRVGVGNALPLILSGACEPVVGACLLANLDAFALDYVTRQKIGGTHLNYYYIRQLPILPPVEYPTLARWSPEHELSSWIASRVLRLVYTSYDMRPLALDLGFDGPPFPWDPELRLQLRCELDAAFFHLYGIARGDVEYIMDTFPIIRDRELKQLGVYRTKEMILEMYDAMQRSMESGIPYDAAGMAPVQSRAR